MDKRTDDLRSEMNGRFEEVNRRFDSLQWTLGIFITIAMVILGFVLRMQWQMHQRQTRMETVLDSQKDDISFIKKIIEKFLPPRGVLCNNYVVSPSSPSKEDRRFPRFLLVVAMLGGRCRLE